MASSFGRRIAQRLQCVLVLQNLTRISTRAVEQAAPLHTQVFRAKSEAGSQALGFTFIICVSNGDSPKCSLAHLATKV